MPTMRFYLIRLVTLIASFTALSSAVHGARYFLGSQAAAQGGVVVSSIDALNALDLEPGDSVAFQSGETFAGTIELNAEDAGTAANPVTVTSFGTSRATIRAGTGSALKIYNAAGFAISKLDLVGSGALTSRASGIDAGVYLPGSTRLDYLRFEEMSVSGFKNGVEIWAWYSTATVAWPGFRDVTLVDLEVFQNRSDGIKTWGTWVANADGSRYSHADFHVADCRVYENRGDPSSTSHTGSGIVLSGIDRATVEYCVAHDNGGLGPLTGGGPFGIWVWEVNAVTLQHNLVYNQKTSSALDGGAYDLDGGSSRCVVQYNYSYNNEGPAIGLIQFSGASPLAQNVIRYNISENDARRSAQGSLYVATFSSRYGVSDADIFGNTIFVSASATGARPAAVNVENQTLISRVRIRNNLFVASHNGTLINGLKNAPARVVYQGNNYFGGSFDLAAFRSYGQEAVSGRPTGTRLDPMLCAPGQGGAIRDPLEFPFLTAYQLQPGSPLAQSGLDLAGLFSIATGGTDFFGQNLSSSALPVGAARPAAPESPAPVAPLLVHDAFSGSGPLGGRVPDSAGGDHSRWVLGQGSVTVANGVATSSEAYARAVIDAGRSDLTARGVITLLGATSYAGLSLRATDNNNFLFFRIRSHGWVFARVINGVATTLASGAGSFSTDRAYLLAAECRGNSIRLFIDGQLVHESAAPLNVTATFFGLTSGTLARFSCDEFTLAPLEPAPEASAPASPSELIADAFSGAGALGGRVPDTVTIAGSRWALTQGSITISDGAATSTDAYVRATLDAQTPDVTVQTAITLLSPDAFAGLSLRAVDNNNFHFFRIRSTGWTFARVTNGTATILASGAGVFPVNIAHRLSADCRSDTFRLFVDGQLVHQSARSGNENATRFGITSGTLARFSCDDFVISP